MRMAEVAGKTIVEEMLPLSVTRTAPFPLGPRLANAA
jgi:hypothetical protein